MLQAVCDNRTHPSSSSCETFTMELEWYRLLSTHPRRTLYGSCGYSHMNYASCPFPSSWVWEGTMCLFLNTLRSSRLRTSSIHPMLFSVWCLNVNTQAILVSPSVKQFLNDFVAMHLPLPPFLPPPEFLCATCFSCVFRYEILGTVRIAKILLAKTKLYLAHKCHSVIIMLPPLSSPSMLRTSMLYLQPSQQLWH